MQLCLEQAVIQFFVRSCLYSAKQSIVDDVILTPSSLSSSSFISKSLGVVWRRLPGNGLMGIWWGRIWTMYVLMWVFRVLCRSVIDNLKGHCVQINAIIYVNIVMNISVNSLSSIERICYQKFSLMSADIDIDTKRTQNTDRTDRMFFAFIPQGTSCPTFVDERD